MQYQQPPPVGGILIQWIHPMKLEFITIAGRPSLDASHEFGPSAGELAPQGSQVCARYPPRWGIGILAGAAHGEVRSQDLNGIAVS